MTNEQKHHLEIIAGIERALKNCEHYKKFSHRIQTHLDKELPGYTFYLDTKGTLTRRYCLSVWGNGLEYVDRILFSWYDGNGETWIDGLRRELQVMNPADRIERAEQEKTIEPQLQKLEDEIKEVLNQTKSEAAHLIKNLPEPKSSVIRRGHYCWSKPSYDLTKKFPFLFGDD